MQHEAEVEALASPPIGGVVGRYDQRLCEVSRELKQAGETDDTETFATARTALAQFFTPETEAAVFEATRPETHRACKLVYMLSSKTLSSEVLNDKEARVASILARFCAESDGAMELYRCKTRFHSVGYTHEVLGYYDENVLTQKLVLLSPWETYPPSEASTSIQVSGVHNWLSAMADVEDEVAPWGLFERPEFEFDARTGTSTRERWHTGTALVLLPVRLRAQLEFAGDEDAMLTNWLPLVDSHPSLAVSVMEAIGETPRVWSLGSPLGARVLHGIKKLRSLPSLLALLKCCRFIEFQPEMCDAVSVFTTEELVSVLCRIHKGVYYPNCTGFTNRLNTVASMLHDEADATRITLVLDAVQLVPSWWSAYDYPRGFVDHTAEEFARVLRVALRVSVDRAKTLATTNHGATAVTIARAVRALVDWGGGPQACGEQVLELVRHAHSQLVATQPETRNFPYSYQLRAGCHESRTCGRCDRLANFIKSTEETAEFDKRECEAHFLDRIQRMNATDKFTVEDVDDATEPPRIRLVKSYEDDTYVDLKAELVALEALLGT